MAEIGRITLSEIALIEIDADPSVGGLEASTGSLAFMTDGSAIYHKNGIGDTAWVRLDKSYIGLPNVDNTADLDKPVPSSITTELNLKAPIASPTFTGTVSGITKSMVGLANIDNTSDLSKPVSTATQSALDLKYNASNPNGYETPSQLNTRDTDNRSRANHTGSQLSTTISDFTQASRDAMLYPETAKVTTAIQSSTSTTYATITELVSDSLAIGTYSFEVLAACQSAATNRGVGLRFQNETATVGVVTANWAISIAANGTDKNFEYSQLSVTDNINSVAALSANTDFPVRGKGFFTVTSAGTVSIAIRSSNNNSGVSIRPNSIFMIKKVA
jgi:hypothetical protein